MKFHIADYSVVKQGFSAGSLESVPLGEGDCGANVWVEKDGILHMLLSKTDSFAESGRLMKLGYLKIAYETPVFSEENPPVLTLDLSDGVITIRDIAGTAELTVAAFVGKALFGIRSHTKTPNRLHVSLYNYRDEIRTLLPTDESAYGYCGAPFIVRESADVVATEDNDCLAWCHHNAWSYYAYSMINQHLTAVMHGDPVLHRIFGCAVAGTGFTKTNGILCGPETASSELYIAAACETAPDAVAWNHRKSGELLQKLPGYCFASLLEENKRWWTHYFTDYYVYVYGTPEADKANRGYLLQKYMLGCAGRGKMPIKFNGSIFTVHPSPYYEKVDYDYRRWGDPFWMQNTRLIYWNMLYSGDFEGMRPFFDFVVSVMPEARERSRVRFGHGGINLPETVTFYGTFADSNYGYGKEMQTPPVFDNTYIRWHYNGQLEIAYMMLKFREFTGGRYDDYFEKTLLPFIEEALLFFREHFPVVDGKMQLKPVSSLETWQDCIDDTPDIAGLRAVCRALRRIGKTPCIDETLLPELPFEIKNGKKVLAPCAGYVETQAKNCETPELYPAFPFDLYTCRMSEEEHEIVQNTFDLAENTFTNGWSQRIEQAAVLGMTDYCRENIVRNFGQICEGCFFETYFGPNFDWVPDQDHGNTTSIGLLFMLLQSYEGEVQKFPAFPADWKAEFRLPSSAGTVEA